MRTTLTFVTALALAASAASAQPAEPQQPALPVATPVPAAPAIVAPGSGIAVLGTRFSDVTGDSYRYQRYRDVSDGAVLDRFRFDRDGTSWHFESLADHVGAADQRFRAAFAGSNRLKASFTWDQIPFNLSDSTRTPYMVAAPGVLRVDGLMQ